MLCSYVIDRKITKNDTEVFKSGNDCRKVQLADIPV